MAAERMDVKYVAQLARIQLGEGEEEALGAELTQILEYVEKLKQLDVAGVEPTAHAVPLLNVTRRDEPGVSLSHEEAMRNAPVQVSGLFSVPKIVE